MSYRGWNGDVSLGKEMAIVGKGQKRGQIKKWGYMSLLSNRIQVWRNEEEQSKNTLASRTSRNHRMRQRWNPEQNPDRSQYGDYKVLLISLKVTL